VAYAESDLLPISALQHLLFCPRQCALIHIERAWAENRWTAEGRVLHKNAHTPQAERRPGVRAVRGMQIRSSELGLFGQADVVEFHTDVSPPSIFPIEYKRGRPKHGEEDLVQLCAQAICLEEMLGTVVPAGAIFYGKTRRRVEVTFDDDLRRRTHEAAAELHAMIRSGITPTAGREKKCDRCSLLHICMPDVLEGREPASRYLSRVSCLIASGSGPTED
jgi:CRISPR-associated exonuclease Cas4